MNDATRVKINNYLDDTLPYNPEKNHVVSEQSTTVNNPGNLSADNPSPYTSHNENLVHIKKKQNLKYQGKLQNFRTSKRVKTLTKFNIVVISIL